MRHRHCPKYSFPVAANSHNGALGTNDFHKSAAQTARYEATDVRRPGPVQVSFRAFFLAIKVFHSRVFVFSSASRRFMLRSGTGLELRHDIPPLPPPVSFPGFDPSMLLDHHILDPNDRWAMRFVDSSKDKKTFSFVLAGNSKRWVWVRVVFTEVRKWFRRQTCLHIIGSFITICICIGRTVEYKAWTWWMTFHFHFKRINGTWTFSYRSRPCSLQILRRQSSRATYSR